MHRAAAILAVALAAAPAAAEPEPTTLLRSVFPCWPREVIARDLEQRGVVKADTGISTVEGWLIERWIGADGEFYIFGVDEEGDACRLASGRGMKPTGAVPGKGA
jgi:hypothetical protein